MRERRAEDLPRAPENTTDGSVGVLHLDRERRAEDLPRIPENTTDSSVGVLHLDRERRAEDLPRIPGNTTDSSVGVLHLDRERRAEDLPRIPGNTTDSSVGVLHLDRERRAEDLPRAAAGLEEPCESAVFSEPQGEWTWSGSNNSSTRCTWLVDLLTPTPLGLVLHFTDLCLQQWAEGHDTLLVTSRDGEVLRTVRGCLPVPPVLVYAASVKVTLSLNRFRDSALTAGSNNNNSTLHGGESGEPGSAESAGSRFRVSYTAQPLHSLPPALASGHYNCSQPYSIPEALRCDMARQCQGGEDETDFNCSYLTAECGDWLPLGDICFRFVFHSSGLAPLDAQSHCPRGILAALRDPDSRRLAATVASLSGHQDLVVPLKKKEAFLEKLSHIYRFMWGWSSPSHLEADGPDLSLWDPSLNCVTLRLWPVVHFHPVDCSRVLRAGVGCMRSRWERGLPESRKSDGYLLTYPSVTRPLPLPAHQCEDGSLVLAFQQCPYAPRVFQPSAGGTKQPLLRYFPCDNDIPLLYTYTCDGHNDCGDESDESYCFLSSIFYRGPSFFCRHSHELVPEEKRCDGQKDCWDGSDETLCLTCKRGTRYFKGLGCLPEAYAQRGFHRFVSRSAAGLKDAGPDRVQGTPPGLSLATKNGTRAMRVLTVDGYGASSLRPSPDGSCPETHYQCPLGLCIPSFMMENSDTDCPFPFSDDDVVETNDAACPGHYRCRQSSICLHPDLLCDGVIHCPYKDDERHCNSTCPEACTCLGLEYTCTQDLDPQQYPHARYLDLSHVVKPDLSNMRSFRFLRLLNLSHCGLDDLPSLSIIQLKVLDLSFNQLTSTQLDHFILRYLNLTGNPLVAQLTAGYMDVVFFDVTHSDVWSLSLAGTGIRHIANTALQNFTELRYLDVSGTGPVRFGRDSLRGLASLQTLVADDQRLCCAHQALYPDSQLRCQAPVDELSSCSDLLRSPFLRVMLWLQAAMAVMGNSGVFVFRVFGESARTSAVFRVLVTHLCVADLLMGVYLVIIGAADARYSGQYLWEADSWKESGQCKAAGFLSLLSSEVSALLICLITLDRFLALRFPFRPALRLTSRSANVVCGVAWGVGVLLAAVPLLPVTSHWQFYGQSGICLPLPITRRQFPGQAYSFAVFIGLNFVLFLLIGAGQLSVFLAIHCTPAAGRSERRQQEAAIARRLFLVVLTDFCCWFPVGVMGLLAARGIPIPGELNVWTAVLVLPLNSALNPFLYTLNTLLERRERRREAKRMARVISRMRAELAKWPEHKLEELVRFCQSLLRRASSGDGEEKTNGLDVEPTQDDTAVFTVSEPTCDTVIE